MTDMDIKTLRAIYIAFGLMITSMLFYFLYIAFLSPQTAQAPTDEQMDFVKFASQAILLFACVMYPIAWITFRIMLPRSSGRQPTSDRIKMAYVFRIAIFEGVAIFSLSTGIMSAPHGVFQTQPSYLLITIPCFVVMGIIFATFPSRERLVSHGYHGNLF